MAVLAMFSVIPYAFSSVETNSIEVQAVTLAQQSLESQRDALLQSQASPAPISVPIDPGGQSFEGNGASVIQNYGNFTVTPNGCTVQFAPLPTNNVVGYLCSATTSWTQSGAAKSVTVQSYVTK
jgi:hypothetical protein